MCDIVVVVNILDCQMQHHKPLHPSPPHLRRSTLHFLLPIWVYKVRFGSFDIQLKLAFQVFQRYGLWAQKETTSIMIIIITEPISSFVIFRKFVLFHFL